MRFLAVSGSLRAQSTNTALLRAVQLLAVSQVDVMLYKELDQIPPFNPDNETALNEAGVIGRWRTAIKEADAVIFSTPEYAHGLPGTLKNALDWIVGTGELSRKPVIVVNASSRGRYAQTSLREILTTMDARLVTAAETTVELGGKTLTAEEIAHDSGYAQALRSVLEALVEACHL